MTQPLTDFKRQPRIRAVNGDALKVDHMPPHDSDAEVGILGSCLLDPNERIPEVITLLKGVGSEVFYDLRHQTLWDAILEVYDARIPLDLISLSSHLRKGQILEQVGGMAYLSTVQDAVPSSANASYYVELVFEAYLMRRMIHSCTDVVSRIYENSKTDDIRTLLDGVERDVLAVGQMLEEGIETTVCAVVPRVMTMIERAWESKGEIMGVSTGFPDLDSLTDGLHAGEMWVIAGRPSTGKTAISINIVEHVCLDLKLPVGVFSLEMATEQLVLRMVCSQARLNFRTIKSGFMSEADFPKLTITASKLQHAPLFIDDTAGLSVLQLRARARRMHQKHNVKLLVVDYLQLLHGTSRKAQDNRQQEIAEISSGIKALAKELKIPIIVLSQLNREMEKNNRRPRMSDLRESGAIEQDADLIGLLYRPEQPEDEDSPQENDGHPVNMLVAKQRNGEAGVDVKFTFLKCFTRFESASPVSDEDVPPRESYPRE